MLSFVCRPRLVMRSASIAARKCCGWRAPNCLSAALANAELRPRPIFLCNFARSVTARLTFLAILIHVLHFAQQPRRLAIAEAARVLSTGRPAA